MPAFPDQKQAGSLRSNGARWSVADSAESIRHGNFFRERRTPQRSLDPWFDPTKEDLTKL
jgi:hypothetical protein